jgi:hypothetical protein
MDFELLRIPYLNPSIRTSQAMAWFGGLVILGTGRAPLGFLGRFTGKEGGRLGSGRSQAGSRDEDGAQVVVFNPESGEWALAYESPIVEGRDGKARARDRSVRAALVCQTAADSKPVLYLGVGSLERNVVFLRSEDGLSYTECPGSGFNIDGDLPSVRTMVCHEGRLFCTPTGKNYTRGIYDDNMTDHPIVFETRDPMSGEWTATNEPGFGDPENKSINEMAIFNDHLYAGTLNPRFGYQVWRAELRGKPPYRWRQVIANGAWGGAGYSIPPAMVVFNGALYVSGAIQRQGKEGLHRFGPFPGEMIRIWPDDSWELVTGAPRFTPHGFKRPITGLEGGLGDRYTHAFWRTAIFDNTLYVGTAEWRWAPTYLSDRPDLSPAQESRLRADTNAYVPGSFAVWRTRDGESWEAVTRTGFTDSSRHNYGIREMISTPHGLFVAPTATLGGIAGGGLELWWGRPAKPGGRGRMGNGRSGKDMPPPLFILSPPRSFTSIACAMLGNHPEMFGLAEVNLFWADTVGELRKLHQKNQRLQFGLLRSLAEIAFSEQTDETIKTARSWLLDNAEMSTAELFRTMASWLDGRTLIDKSPLHVMSDGPLQRIGRAFPDAYYLHLTRHPSDMLRSVEKVSDERGTASTENDRMAARLIRSAGTRVADELWLRPHLRILQFLETVPRDRRMRMRGEDLLSEPATYLAQVAGWLGKRTDPEAIEAMLHPEASPFAKLGPPSAPHGGDPNFMESPALRPYRFSPRPLELTVGNGRSHVYSEPLVAYAMQFGY